VNDQQSEIEVISLRRLKRVERSGDACEAG
jgi:hypothetical protein